MSSPVEKLVAELSHEINSPLAAIRNALYLVGCHSSDAEVHRYLEIADREAVHIAGILQRSRKLCVACSESKRSLKKAA